MNVEVNYLHRKEDLKLIDGTAEAIRLLNEDGYKVIVITNQAGVARGYYTEADVKILHDYMNEVLERDGAHVDAFYYCPHHPEHGIGLYKKKCHCRKPETGMFEMADGHTLLRYLEAAYFGAVTWEIVPGTPYERAILGEVDKTSPEYRAFYQKICAGAAAHIKKRIGKERQNVKEPISEINKESFWDLIHEAKNACGQDMDAMLANLKDRLVSMGPTQAQNFHDIIHAYEDLADKFGLWDAAGIMKEYGCSDDGFIDFRAWLIAQGREVYFAALSDPDSLADVVPYGDCCFEQLSYVGDYAYEQLTGKSAYDQTDWSAYEALLLKLEQGIVYKGGIEFPREGADLKKYLPRLCAKHPEWDGQTRWNPQMKEIRDLIRAGKDYDRRQTSNKKKRSRGGEAR